MSVVDSRIWGPNVWYFIHQVAYAFIRENRSIPEKEKRLLKSCMTYLKPLMPCPSCRAHYARTLSRFPVERESRNGRDIFNWSVRAHNLANKGLKKKVLTYTQAKNIHKGPIQYNKLEKFIDVILIQSKNKALSTRRSMAVCVVNLFPCTKCRSNMLRYQRNNKLKKISTNSDMTKWARGLMRVFRRSRPK